jgi:DnaJ-domain-containing protein 1
MLKETKESLSEVSGIKNEHILQKMVELNVRPETLTSLSLIPLVEVAWADGSVDDKEKESVLSCVEKMGFSKGSADHEILSQWMTHRPSKELMDAWIHYIQGLCEKLTSEEKNELKKELIINTRSVAMASGGFLGLGNKISKSESAILDQLENAFN